jgi:hypothetical protein
MPGFDGAGREDFAAGQVYGLRWYQHHDGTGLVHGAWAPWNPGLNEAVCLSPDAHRQRDVPVETCGCGFWAYWDTLAASVGGPWPGAAIMGVVKGYGTTLIGSRGFRCSKSEITAFHIPAPPPYNPYMLVTWQRQDDWAEWHASTSASLRAKYKVPVYGTLNEMLARHPLTPDYRREPGGIRTALQTRQEELIKRFREMLSGS